MPLSDESTAVIVHAARHGWLIATPHRIVAGWGEAHDVPQYEDHIGFVSSSFDGNLTVVYPLTTVSIDASGAQYFGAGDAVDDSAHAPLPSITVTSNSADSYRDHVSAALQRVNSGQLEKIVVARPFDAESSAPVDEGSVALALRAIEPSATIYAFPTASGARFIGASPELLLEQRGAHIRMQPLAGTAPRGHEDSLLGSAKDRHEHAVMIENVTERLAERGIPVTVGPLGFRELSSVVHLATVLTGELPHELRDPCDIVSIVHPTAAVAGIPLAAARAAILELEAESRDMYAGAVGWIQGDENAQWWVAIRGLTVMGTHLRFWAGAGIVTGSTPDSELAETELKFRSVAKIFPLSA
jgi:isochorismate synthase